MVRVGAVDVLEAVIAGEAERPVGEIPLLMAVERVSPRMLERRSSGGSQIQVQRRVAQFRPEESRVSRGQRNIGGFVIGECLIAVVIQRQVFPQELIERQGLIRRDVVRDRQPIVEIPGRRVGGGTARGGNIEHLTDGPENAAAVRCFGEHEVSGPGLASRVALKRIRCPRSRAAGGGFEV